MRWNKKHFSSFLKSSNLSRFTWEISWFQKSELGKFIPNFPLKHVITRTKIIFRRLRFYLKNCLRRLKSDFNSVINLVINLVDLNWVFKSSQWILFNFILRFYPFFLCKIQFLTCHGVSLLKLIHVYKEEYAFLLW